MNYKRFILLVINLTLVAAWSFAGQNKTLEQIHNRTALNRAGDNNIGFSGWLLVTDDQDWREKWDTPENSVPKFSEVHEVRLGEKITILTFYRNPLPDEKGQIDIRCDLTVTKPDGSLSFQQEDMECAKETLQGNPGNLRLTSVIINFIGEIGDPYGRWTVAVTLKDENRGVEIPLQTSFVLINTSRFTWRQFIGINDGSHT